MSTAGEMEGKGREDPTLVSAASDGGKQKGKHQVVLESQGQRRKTPGLGLAVPCRRPNPPDTSSSPDGAGCPTLPLPSD